jgi:hypothetical protein
MYKQNIDIAGVVLHAPMANDKQSVSVVTVHATPASRTVAAMRSAVEARRSLCDQADSMMYVSSMPMANAMNGATHT